MVGFSAVGATTARKRRVLRTGLALAGLLLVPALAMGIEWDQQKVAKTSRGLQRALDALLADPGLGAEQSTAMQQREFAAAITTVQEVSRINDELSRRLASGYDREETQAFWDQINELRGDISTYARRAWLPGGTRVRANRAAGLLDELATYYEAVE